MVKLDIGAFSLNKTYFGAFSVNKFDMLEKKREYCNKKNVRSINKMEMKFDSFRRRGKVK